MENSQMSARQKLNSVYMAAATISAVAVGLITQSYILFIVSLISIAALMIHDGTVRPTPHRRHSRR
jgi:hypothetical protein